MNYDNKEELSSLINTITTQGIQNGNKIEIAVESRPPPDYDENKTYFLEVVRLERELELAQDKLAQATKDLDVALKTITKISTFSSVKLREENAQLRYSAQTNLQALNDIKTTYEARMKTYAQIVAKLQAEVKSLTKAVFKEGDDAL